MKTLKPFELALVPIGDATIIGQIMSKPTPEGTIMVRRVPGIAGTLEELPISGIEPMIPSNQKKFKYLHVATIGSFFKLFPDDMLRYDSCSIIEKVVREPNVWIVGKLTSNRKNPWTEDRWNSFTCSIRKAKCFLLDRLTDEIKEVKLTK